MSTSSLFAKPRLKPRELIAQRLASLLATCGQITNVTGDVPLLTGQLVHLAQCVLGVTAGTVFPILLQAPASLLESVQSGPGLGGCTVARLRC